MSFDNNVASLNPRTREFCLLELKGLVGSSGGRILLTPNERRVIQNRRDCYWLCWVTSCETDVVLVELIRNPARVPWHEAREVQLYCLTVDALTGD